MFNNIAAKLISGRFLLTLIIGFTFAYLACNGTISASDAQIIIAIVITFYFTKNRDATNGNNKQ